MRSPARPPEIGNPFDDIRPGFEERWLHQPAISFIAELTARKGYIHWDDLRHHPLPDGLNQ